MEKIRLGRTNLMVSKSGFGALPIQRVNFDDAKAILRRAYDAGINFYDTARAYTDSEEKISYALADVRQNIIIATKSMAQTADEVLKDLEVSLNTLKTDYIDIFQFHNLSFNLDENHELYQAALKAKKEGKIRFISLTSHRLDVSMQATSSGLFDTVQFPLSALSTPEEFKLVDFCKKHDVGIIAMKAMSGGLITNPTATFALLRSYGNILPIWGIQRMCELEDFLKLEENPPKLTEELLQSIEKDKLSFAGNFCRACGYCMPTCPAQIDIASAARMSLLLGRASVPKLITPAMQEKMKKIEECTDCGECRTHCPYHLDTPVLLRAEYEFYQKFLKEHNIVPQ